MRVSVVVPVYDDPRIELCLSSLLAQEYPEGTYQIIVVDNGSGESIRRIIRRFPVVYVNEERKGPSYARNRGLEVASGDMVAFLDADCVADKYWLNSLVRSFVRSTVGGAGGRILKLQPRTWVEHSAEELNDQQVALQYLPFFPGPWIATGNAAYRMSVLQELGGFDTELQTGEDVDLAWRVWMLGYEIITVPEAIVYHAAKASVGEYFKQYFRYAVGHTLLFKKHRSATGRQIFIDTYPFKGLAKTMGAVLPKRLARWLFGKTSKTEIAAVFLDLVKYTAVMCGDLYGAISHRVPYI